MIHLKKKEGASTSTSRNNPKYAYRNMGYRDPGNFIKYTLSGIQSSIRRDEPVQVAGYSKIKYYILGIPVYDGGHSWVIDGYARMTTTVKDKYSGEEIEDYPLDYVHCNLGWHDIANNGWYISGIFDTNNIPHNDTEGEIEKRSVEEDYFYQYDIQMLTGIRPE